MRNLRGSDRKRRLGQHSRTHGNTLSGFRIRSSCLISVLRRHQLSDSKSVPLYRRAGRESTRLAEEVSGLLPVKNTSVSAGP